MPHITTTTIIAVAFVLLAIGAVIGVGLLIADMIMPLVQSATHGESLRDRFAERFARLRTHHDEDDDDEDSDDLEESTAALLSMLPGAPIVVDESDEVVRANPDAYRLGVVDDDVIVEPRIAQAVRTVREQGGKTMFELTTMTPQRFLRMAGADETDGQGNVASGDAHATPVAVSRPNWLRVTVGRISERFVIVLLDDVSERVRFAQVRDDFIANVSEQLVKPSAELQHLAASLEQAGLEDARIAQDARNVRRTIAYIDHMVKDLLLLIKAQEQVTPTDENRLNVLNEARAAAEVAQPLAQERGQRIAVSGSDALVVHGESEQIRAAIDKLIENALEYSPDGAVVSVDVKPDRAGRHAVVRVIDRGTGIPLGEQQRIFERFYRGANQNEHTADGVGLGLAIVKHVALTHQGSVHVWSRPGQGSTFTLVLPLDPAQAD
ncbi:sensor histidine kinase [Bifidobacterium pseudolongum]|nr:ATP-binding protein [Bifidobacterium pseudolongum]